MATDDLETLDGPALGVSQGGLSLRIADGYSFRRVIGYLAAISREEPAALYFTPERVYYEGYQQSLDLAVEGYLPATSFGEDGYRLEPEGDAETVTLGINMASFGEALASIQRGSQLILDHDPASTHLSVSWIGARKNKITEGAALTKQVPLGTVPLVPLEFPVYPDELVTSTTGQSFAIICNSLGASKKKDQFVEIYAYPRGLLLTTYTAKSAQLNRAALGTLPDDLDEGDSDSLLENAVGYYRPTVVAVKVLSKLGAAVGEQTVSFYANAALLLISSPFLGSSGQLNSMVFAPS